MGQRIHFARRGGILRLAAAALIAVFLLCCLEARSFESVLLKPLEKSIDQDQGLDADAAKTSKEKSQCVLPNREPCPDGAPGVKCAKDPCDKTCDRFPKATCHAFICKAKSKFKGEMIGGGCQAVYVDDSCDVVKCKKIA